MKKIVISLLRRSDRKSEWQKNNLNNFEYIKAIDGNDHLFRNIKAKKNWVDPFQNRPLQQNEVACFLSHIQAWHKCIELNQAIIIMEDDAIINDTWNEDYYSETILNHDFVYLQRNENEPDKTVSIDDKLERPAYPYNMTAYCINPKMAHFLISSVQYDAFIPVDEFLPSLFADARLCDLSIVALKKDACNQLPRNLSDIENGVEFKNYKIHVVTCGTDRKKCIKLNTSARHHGIDIINIGTNIEWKGTDMTALGGGMKINLMHEFLKDIPENDIVLFTDAYDVFYADNLDTIVERFKDFKCETVFSAESICWPNAELSDQFPESNTPYKYLNSGTYIGYASELKKIMAYKPIKDHEDDQLYVQNIFLNDKTIDIELDYESYIFQTHEPKIQKINNQLNNPLTQCCPCIYHGNGGDDALNVFNSIYEQFYPQTSALFIPNYNKYECLTDDMLLVDFMTQEQCERLIEIADDHGGWDSLDYDKFPAKEIRLRQIDIDKKTKLFDELNNHWNEYIVPTVEQYWKPLQMYGLRDAFVMRYALDTQVSLNLHHDASLVTGSVKLNDDYVGADLIYPRQGISNKDIPVGKMILFPGQLTHGHECLPLQQGVKYSLTIWSCRFIADTI